MLTFHPMSMGAPRDSRLVYLRPFPNRGMQLRINKPTSELSSAARHRHLMLFWIRQFFSNREFHKRAFEEVFVIAVVSIFPLN